ncbi:hypothetical protein V8F20_005212 [Naviculisporaceae sp. PSN 640]
MADPCMASRVASKCRKTHGNLAGRPNAEKRQGSSQCWGSGCSLPVDNQMLRWLESRVFSLFPQCSAKSCGEFAELMVWGRPWQSKSNQGLSFCRESLVDAPGWAQVALSLQLGAGVWGRSLLTPQSDWRVEILAALAQCAKSFSVLALLGRPTRHLPGKPPSHPFGSRTTSVSPAGSWLFGNVGVGFILASGAIDQWDAGEKSRTWNTDTCRPYFIHRHWGSFQELRKLW